MGAYWRSCTPGSQRDRIIEAMRMSSIHLDDDQLADRAGISPRRAGCRTDQAGAAGR